MQQLELTEEHKSKLLEMCKVLFPKPEYSFWWEYEMYGRGLKQNFNDVLCVCHTVKKPIIEIYNDKEFERFNNYFNIHWFEFCMTHLASKLCKRDFNALSLNTYSNLIQHNQHPVDYLYEEFKKLKI